ncbi:Kef-type K+ transport system membrane component KefB [Halorubrum alkaliphilum]|uniref:Kef-type K+ transport system membrane component KefB n=1 Tax=Halorubrum alkaliphilum TaxID=261290 RepID=A0A8T4GDC8_9EURY|nr:cation:proton antiporter [Halorubrum alkaliphilum]MBP1921719.1 Kef-type K+ transport system membrane component KefB [Halorubrum alkaliphilum]
MAAGSVTIATDFALIVLTAVALGYLFRLSGQPTIVAYLVTGIVLGPVFLDVITEGELVELMAELGLGFLLFLLGLKLRIDDIREILRPVINIALWQTVLQTALAFAVAYALGFTLVQTTIIALATVFGATPIIVKVLADKDELTSLPGKIDVGVLILQDIYLVVLLAILGADSFENPTTIAANIAEIFVLMAGIGVFSYLAARHVLPGLFRMVAGDREAFFIVGIAWAFLFIYGSMALDLSIEVGAFLAGLSLAQVQYTTELTERVRPLTDLFMVVFFSSIGLRIAADDLFEFWQEAVIASIALMLGNFLIMFYLINREDFTPETSFLGSINMVQVSEFSLVVGALAVQQEFIEEPILGYLSLMAIMTMSASTYLIKYNHQLYDLTRPLWARFESDDKRDVELKTYRDHAVVIGVDDVTEPVLPVLHETVGDVVIVDRNPETSDRFDDTPYDVIYGDFKHGELRKEAGLDRASVVLSSSVQSEINETAIREADDDALVIVESDGVDNAVDLYEAGAHYVTIPTVLAGIRIREYLTCYIRDRSAFRTLVDDDIGWLRSAAAGPSSVEPGSDRSKPGADRFDPDADRFDPDADRFDPDADRFDPDADRFDPDGDTDV